MGKNLRFLIIGGSDAGISAALRAREVDASTSITVLLADDYPNFSICGLPFFLSGETPDWHSLAHRTEFPGIHLMPNHTAESIDSLSRVVTVRCANGSRRDLPYDKLLIGTGARPVRPEMEGLNLPGVFPLHTMGDSFAVHRFLEEHKPNSAIIVGAGYIGLEMADALVHRGLQVTLASRTPAVLATVDPAYGRLVEVELRKHGVEVWNQVEVGSIQAVGNHLAVSGTQSFTKTVDLVLVAVGVQPNRELGRRRGYHNWRKRCTMRESAHGNKRPGHLRSRRLRRDVASSLAALYLSTTRNHGS